MLTSTLLGKFRILRTSLNVIRNKADVSDPIHKLYLKKLKEYKQKSASRKIVPPSPALEKQIKAEIAKLEKHYGGGLGIDMTTFPSFKFGATKLSIDEPAAASSKKKVKKVKK